MFQSVFAFTFELTSSLHCYNFSIFKTLLGLKLSIQETLKGVKLLLSTKMVPKQNHEYTTGVSRFQMSLF